MSARAALREVAFTKHGVFTLDDAQDRDIETKTVAQLAWRGVVERVGPRTYQHLDVPVTQLTSLEIALESVGDAAYLVDDTVLAMFDLALVSPNQVHVQTRGRRPRRELPPGVSLERRTRENIQIVNYQGLRHMSVYDALRRSRKRLRGEQVQRGADEALRRGLITKMQHQQLC